MRKILLLCLPLAVLFASCKDETGTITVSFQATYGGSPLTMFENVDYDFGQRVEFTRAEFYVSNLRIYDLQGQPTELSDIELIDLSFNTRADAENGVTLTFSGIPTGTYQSMEFGIGVDDVLNATVPADYDSSHPLSNTGRYWHAWNSFIFSKIEGNLDTLGTDNPDLGFAYHTGTDDMYLNVGTGFPMTVSDGLNTTVTFRMNYKALMGVDANPIDIQAKPQNHNPTDTFQINVIRDNYLGALSFIVN